MNFLTPLFLLGGLAIALPVLFHLVRRSTRDRVTFSSLMFLKPTPPRLTRRSRLEHIFLLLLRCLAILLLAAAFARPFLQKPMDTTPSASDGTRTVFLVDTSASMRRDGLWDAALERCQTALNKTTLADQVAIFTYDDQIRGVVSFEEWASMNISERPALSSQRLAGSKPTWRATHLGNALMAAMESIEDAGKEKQFNGARRIVLITDLQEGSRLDGLQGFEWPRDVQVTVETVKPRRPTNAGLQWVMDAEDAPAASDAGGRLRISNSSDAKREQFLIRAGTATVDAYVPPGQSRIVQAPKSQDGSMPEHFALTGDDEDFDNTVHMVQSKPDEVSVWYIGDEKEQDSKQLLYYVKRAFQETRRQKVSIVATSSTGPLPSQKGRLVIMSGRASGESLNAVRQLLKDGGTVLFVMKDTSAAQTLSQLAGIPEFTATENTSSKYAMFGRIDFQHPLFAPFADPRFSDFTKIHFWKYRRIPADKLPGAHVVAAFDTGDPAIVELPVDRGNIFILASSGTPTDSQLALSSKFIPLLYGLLEQSGEIKAQIGQYRIGDIVRIPAVLAANGVDVRTPDGKSVHLAAGTAQFPDTDQPGIYEISGTPPVRFAVNLDAAESRTAPLPVEELERLNVPLKPLEISALKLTEQRRQLQNTELEGKQKLWRWLIVAALVVLMGETWLAGRLTRRAAPSEATA